MANIWVISDTHFGHDNIIRYEDRPFENSYYMNQAIRDLWNETVKDGDKVYHLGDVYMGKNGTGGESIEDFLKSLKGQKRLILGNHDNGRDQILQRVFKKIDVWRPFKEYGLVLSHIPLHENSLRFGAFQARNIHGHTHRNDVLTPSLSKDVRYLNVCVEKTDYKPINIEELHRYV